MSTESRSAFLLSTNLLRRCDGIIYGIISLLLFIIVPSIREDIVGVTNNLFIIPLFVVVIFTVLLPSKIVDGNCKQLFRLKCVAITTLLISPFFSWWLHFINNLYYTICAALATILGCWYIIELSNFLQSIITKAGKKSHLLHGLIISLVLAPILAIHLVFVIYCLDNEILNPNKLLYLWNITAPLLKITISISIFILIKQLWRIPRNILNQTLDTVEKIEILQNE